MNMFSIFTGSLYSAETYRTVRQSGQFFVGYALLVVALCTLVVTLYYTQFIHRELFMPREGKPAVYDDVVRQIAAQLPTMTLHNSELKSSLEAPTTIEVTADAFGASFQQLPVITIDTSGNTTHSNSPTAILVTNKEFVFKSDKEIKIRPISDFVENPDAPLIINRALIDDMANRAISWVHENISTMYLIVGSICWVMFVVYMFILRLIMLLLLGLVGLAIGSLTKSPLRYAQAVGLAAVSYTPVALLDTLLFAGFGYPVSPWILLLAGTVALLAAIRCSNPPAAASLVM